MVAACAYIFGALEKHKTYVGPVGGHGSRVFGISCPCRCHQSGGLAVVSSGACSDVAHSLEVLAKERSAHLPSPPLPVHAVAIFRAVGVGLTVIDGGSGGRSRRCGSCRDRVLVVSRGGLIATGYHKVWRERKDVLWRDHLAVNNMPYRLRGPRGGKPGRPRGQLMRRPCS